MSRGPESGCPEPVYPRILRASSSEGRFEEKVDLGPEGEGIIVFERKSAIQILKSLPTQERLARLKRARELATIKAILLPLEEHNRTAGEFFSDYIVEPDEHQELVSRLTELASENGWMMDQ